MSVMGEDALVPRARSRLPVMCAAGLGFLTLAVAWLLDSDKYHGRMSEIFRACFRGSGILGMCAIFLMLMLGGVSFSVKQWSHFNLMCAGYMLLNSLGVLGPAPVEISEICEAKKMNVAHGLAWSFYIGYLKFLLPALEVNVREYSRRERLSSPRLHILLPLNARVPSKPEEEDTNVVFHENLPDLKLDRAGVRKRSYTNSVYKITHNNEARDAERGRPRRPVSSPGKSNSSNQTFSCILEYATPLLTLYQMSQESSAGFGERERKQQVLLFYRTLSQILDNSLECRNRYRLILLNDEHTGDPHYLSRELFQNLKQQDGEIFMDPTNEVHPVPEEGPVGNCNGALQATFHEEPMSDEPTLMFSRPQSLRSEPVETTDYFNPSSAMKQN